MSLKNNYLFKKLLKCANKKQNSFNIYNVTFFLKKKKNTWIYHYFTPVYQKSQWYDLQFLRYRAWQTEIGNFRLFFTLIPKKEPKKSKFWKNEKYCWRYRHYCTKKQNHIWFTVPRYRMRQTEFFVILGHFLLFCPPNDPENKNFGKMKKSPGDITTSYTCTIFKNHMMYGSWDMECNGQNFFIILDRFLPFYPSINLKNQNF